MSYSDASRSNKNFQPGFWDWAKRGHQTAQRSQLFNVYNGSSSSSLDRMELIDGLWRTHTYIHKKKVCTHTIAREIWVSVLCGYWDKQIPCGWIASTRSCDYSRHEQSNTRGTSIDSALLYLRLHSSYYLWLLVSKWGGGMFHRVVQSDPLKTTQMTRAASWYLIIISFLQFLLNWIRVYIFREALGFVLNFFPPYFRRGQLL